jgi:uncharacterized protein
MEVATTTGALIGASLALRVSTAAIAEVFGAVLLYSAAASLWPRARSAATESADAAAMSLELDSGYPTASGIASYHVHHILGGTSVMLGAGMLSGLLGIGSGAFKVIAFDRIMRVPFKVSTTTSNFMIGVTAAASVGLYLQRGYIDPGLGTPVVLGVLCGSFLGAHMLPGMKTSVLRHIFAAVIAVLAIEMILHGLKGTV